MTVKDDLKVISEHWEDEVFDTYQACYRGDISWDEYCNYAIESVLDRMASLKNYEWEE